LLLSLPLFCKGQIDASHDIYQLLKAKDSLIFHIGFVSCEVERYADLLSQDFEFYHDQGGVLESYDAFIENTKNGLCSGEVNTRRALDAPTLQVYPLYDNGKLYGALQTGTHRFYQMQDGKESLGSTAEFAHLWILENRQWKLRRVISYNHH